MHLVTGMCLTTAFASAGMSAYMLLRACEQGDAPERIDVPKLARVTRWMYATGWAVSETVARPGVVPGFRLER